MSRQSSMALLALVATSLLGGSAGAQQDSPASQGLKIKGFHLGMSKSDVHQLYE